MISPTCGGEDIGGAEAVSLHGSELHREGAGEQVGFLDLDEHTPFSAEVDNADEVVGQLFTDFDRDGGPLKASRFGLGKELGRRSLRRRIADELYFTTGGEPRSAWECEESRR